MKNYDLIASLLATDLSEVVKMNKESNNQYEALKSIIEKKLKDYDSISNANPEDLDKSINRFIEELRNATGYLVSTKKNYLFIKSYTKESNSGKDEIDFKDYASNRFELRIYFSEPFTKWFFFKALPQMDFMLKETDNSDRRNPITNTYIIDKSEDKDLIYNALENLRGYIQVM